MAQSSIQKILTVLAETGHYLIINKPAEMDSQNSKPGRPSVVDWLQHKYGYSGLVHRLDFGTSGAMVCAKNAGAARALTEELNRGNIGRTYLAVVLGGGTRGTRQDLPDEGVIDAMLDGKEARTLYRVIERFANAALVEVRLDTGRKHQIRRHFAGIGHPLLGDHLYGAKGAKLLFARPALHAWRLNVAHGGKKYEYEAPIPEDLSGLLTRLRTTRS